MRDDENDDADVGLNGQRLFDETDNGAGGQHRRFQKNEQFCEFCVCCRTVFDECHASGKELVVGLLIFAKLAPAAQYTIDNTI